MPFSSNQLLNSGSLPAPSWNEVSRIGRFEADDADEHARNLTAWEQSYDQITRGPFHGMLTELQLPQMQVFLEQTSQAVRQSCRIGPDAFWFGVQRSATAADGRCGSGVRINGRPVDTDRIMVRPGNCAFELLTPAGFAVYGIVIGRACLVGAAQQLGCCIDWTQLAQVEVLLAAESTRQVCLKMLDCLMVQDPMGSPHQAVVRLAGAEQAVTMAVLSLLDASKPDTAASNSFLRRQRIVASARDHALGQCDRLITVPDLCERLHVSRRTLQYCFEDVLGISPIQYLRIIRLNGARRALCEHPASSRKVSEIAADWGFWHLGQFSSDYRKLFGKSPSESLRHGTRLASTQCPSQAQELACR